MTEAILQKRPYPLGAHAENGGVRFSFVSKSASCGILLYDRTSGRLREKIPFTASDRIGNIYCRTVKDVVLEESTYLFYEDDRLVPDERARAFPGKLPYGKPRTEEALRAGFLSGSFDWGNDRCPRLPYRQVVVYCMHVRGFTKHASSGVEHRGTFDGIVQKIPYLKEIGITTLELQPAYEFEEMPGEEQVQNLPFRADPGSPASGGNSRLNYWGYKKGYYYVPKAAYASSGDVEAEFKGMVKALHENGMELVMQFYFPDEVNRSEIRDILCFWVAEYHVDGFHLMGNDIPADMLATDDALADTKLWYYSFDTDRIYGKKERPSWPHAAEYNDSWCYEMRRFLKGDANMLGSVSYHMRHIPEKEGSVHYLTNYSGFTLADLVSYDHKHNEANGEENRDGNDYNCSWNCGEEGATRRASVKKLRLKQIKNAMCLLLLSQSTPLIFMGDEFGNSQRGNNNPYCQDNAVTWLDWNGIKKNAEIHAFWKMLVRFRREHPVLRPEREMRLTDYIACGYPDLSYHGEYAWRFQTECSYRHMGVMLCGKYAGTDDSSDAAFLYLGVNMHWMEHDLALPRLPKGLKWELAFATESALSGQENEEAGECPELVKRIPPRSMAMYLSVPG